MAHTRVEALPHGFPFRLLDRVLEIDGSAGTGVKNITSGDFSLHDAPPASFPDMLIVEAMAELSGLVMNYGKEDAKGAFLAGISGFRFTRPAVIPEQVRIVSRLDANFSALASFSVSAYVGSEVIATGTLVMAETDA